MNEKFFALPIEKQQRILDAAYQVFSKSSYKGASMSEIASNAGISKALLFHYFANKKELYLYLWNNALELTRKAVSDYRVLKTDDFLRCCTDPCWPNAPLWQNTHISAPFL